MFALSPCAAFRHSSVWLDTIVAGSVREVAVHGPARRSRTDDDHRATATAGQVAEPGGQVAEPTRQVAEPADRVAEPADRLAEPADRVAEPAYRVESEPAPAAPARPPGPPAPGPPAPAGPAAAPTPVVSPKTRRTTRILFTLVAVLSLLEAAAFTGNYLLYSRHYVSTDNAQVDGDKVDINAPATGLVTDWRATQGSTVNRGEILGRITIQGSSAQPRNTVRSPGAGTVAVDNVVDGEWVNAGDEMATAYDFNSIYVTARVSENDISEVRIGRPVDISVDAYPRASVTGIVQEIQASAAGQFSTYPGPDTDPTNPRKVDQYVPVKIAFTNTGRVELSPGMNVTVHIHKEP
jgi:hypothetical protein